VTGVPELAQIPEAIGAAFTLPIHVVSAPIKGSGGVVVERVDSRIPANRTAFDAQKETLRQQAVQQLRQQRVRDFLTNLRAVAKITDKRKQVEASSRRQTQ
jgi:peptidyl-prolyl cis-trans isomerase D